MTAVTTKTTPASGYSFTQLESIWVQAGGEKKLAPTMAAIALAESHGNPNAHNDNPTTGDDSYGLWQINYYGANRAPRTARWGPPEGMYNPATNAHAAVELAQGGRGLGNWSTYSNGAFLQYYSGGKPALQNSVTGAPGSIAANLSGDVLKSLGISGIGKDIMYAVVILGGGLLVITGILLIGADLGLAAFASYKQTRPARAVNRVTTTRSKRESRATSDAVKDQERRERSAQRAALNEAQIKTQKARATELRTRTKHRRDAAKGTKAERESALKRAYIQGAADRETPNLRRVR